jgi:hypothetical protein
LKTQTRAAKGAGRRLDFAILISSVDRDASIGVR